jgi:hypothetical protein
MQCWDLDPGYGAFYPWFQDGKKLDPGSGMNIPDLIFEILASVFWVKNI